MKSISKYIFGSVYDPLSIATNLQIYSEDKHLRNNMVNFGKKELTLAIIGFLSISKNLINFTKISANNVIVL